MKSSTTFLLLAATSLHAAGIPGSLRIAEVYKLESDQGRIVLCVDQKLTKKEITSVWGTGELEGKELRNSELRLVSNAGKTLSILKLERPLARLQTNNRIPGEPIRVEVDFSIGMGSYAGPSTRWLQVVGTQLTWAQAKDDQGTPIIVQVASTLKTGWRRVARADGSLDVYEIACRPSFKEDHEGHAIFALVYNHFHFDGAAWTLRSKKRRGYWEADNQFPRESKFP